MGPGTVEQRGVTEPEPRAWRSICALTDDAMDNLVAVETALMAVAPDSLTPLEFRTLMWVRCSLASLYGLRADDAMAGDWEAELDGQWMVRVLTD